MKEVDSIRGCEDPQCVCILRTVKFIKSVCVQRKLHRDPLILHLFFYRDEMIEFLLSGTKLWFEAVRIHLEKQIQQLTKACARWEQREL